MSRHERPVPADGALRKPCSAEEARLGATRDLAATELHGRPWLAERWVRELAGSDQKCPPGVSSRVLCTQLHMDGVTHASRWEGRGRSTEADSEPENFSALYPVRLLSPEGTG